jgi:hypothetical protein
MEPSKRNCHLRSFCESGNFQELHASGRQDLNLRPPGPQPGALPDCATPRGRPMIARYGGLQPIRQADGD